MSYTKQNFQDGQKLKAAHLIKMEEGIIEAPKTVPDLHIWEKHTGKPGTYVLEDAVTLTISNKGTTGSTNTWDTVQYSDSVEIDDSGTVALVNSVGIEISSVSAAKGLLGKYTLLNSGSNVYAVYYVPDDTVFTQVTDSTGSVTTGYRIEAAGVRKVTSEVASKVGYIADENADAYPTSGEQGEGWYEYLGKLGDLLQSGGETVEPETFVAIYGTTTYAEIKAAADAHKICYCTRKTGIHYLPLTAVTSQVIYFSGWMADGKDNYTFAVTPANAWSTIQDYYVKTSTITADSTDKQVPTAKAVYDLVQSLLASAASSE